jgi:hypothetical protein
MSCTYSLLSLGDTLETTPALGGKRHGEPVRRHSRLAGREGVFWRPITRSEAQRILYAAKRFERVHRQKGSRSGPLGGVALEVLELFVNLVSYKTGQLDPSLETIMRLCRRSKDAVVRALANLRQHGFLDWLRRYVPADRDGAGPQVQQTSNAYRMSLPARAAAMVGRWFGAPPPSDDAHRRERAAAKAKAMIDALPLFEQGTASFGRDSPIGAALDRLGAGIMEKGRESARRSESPPSFYSKR